jgi:hypothetical protein
MDALLFFAILVVLAVVAPRWGYDSTDGVDSQQYRLRASWLTERWSLRSGRAARTAGARARTESRALTACPAPAGAVR